MMTGNDYPPHSSPCISAPEVIVNLPIRATYPVRRIFFLLSNAKNSRPTATRSSSCPEHILGHRADSTATERICADDRFLSCYRRHQKAGDLVIQSVELVAKFQELIFFHPARESQLFRSSASPLASYYLFLAIVVSKPQMLFELFLSITQVGLCFYGQHVINLVVKFLKGCSGSTTTLSL